MASSEFPLLLCFLHLLLLLQHTTANIHKTKSIKSNLIPELQQHQQDINTKPTVYFEVTKPIKHPKIKPCSHHVLQTDFGYTYGKPPIFANYTPPLNCAFNRFSKIVLKWHATCKGRQFDRIFGVWLNGVELLRSCSAEPRATGIVWTVEKDITRYYSLLMKNETQLFSVYMGNLVDKTYTGVYHVNISIDFYPAKEKLNGDGSSSVGLASRHRKHADLILPISRNLPLNDGLWFEIENSTDTEVKDFAIPRNVYRAVLEVYVSFHEFWYGNLPNEYITANNLTGYAGNGPFREVVVSLDGEIVGAVWPFTVIFTGGINPLLWRPITGIGSFNLPSYDIEITPFLGNLVNGKAHKIGFSVTNALNVWYIDANLHLWLDDKSTQTEGKLLKHSAVPLLFSLVSDFKGLNGTFLTKASRSISSAGWVKSSHGNVTTHFLQGFDYRNSMVMGKNANLQIIDQVIDFKDGISTKMPSASSLSRKSLKKFVFYLYSDYLDQGNDTSLSVANLTLGFNEEKSKGAGLRSSVSYLNNTQNGQGVMVVKNNLVVSGVGSTQQVYQYNDGRLCYFRNISSSNYTILYDKANNKCDQSSHSQLGFGLTRSWPFAARRAFLTSDLRNSGGEV